MKKLLLISLCFIMTFNILGFASGTNKELELNVLKNYENLDQSLNEVFITSKEKNISKHFVSKYNPKLHYTTHISDINEIYSQVEITGTLMIKNVKYPFSAIGNVEKFTVDGTVYYLGALEGKITVEGIEYGLLLGYTANSNKENITFNIATDKSQICFIFGEAVITEELDKRMNANKKRENLSEELRNDIMYPFAAASSSGGRTFKLVKSQTANINHTNFSTQKGVTAHFYDQIDDTVCMIMMQSYKGTFEQALKNWDRFSQSLRIYQVKGSVAVGNGKGKIVGTHPSTSQNSSSTYLLNLFSEVVGMLDVVNPIPMLSLILSPDKGGITASWSSFTGSIQVNAGTQVTINCDGNVENYLPLFFGYAKNESGYFEGTFTGEIQYQEKYSIPGSGYVYIYYNSKPASSSFSICK